MLKEIRSIAISLKSSLGLILFDAFMHQVEVGKRSRLAANKKRHEKKLFSLRRQNVNVNDSPVFTKQTIHIFSSYILSNGKEFSLYYGLDQHIPNNSRRNTIKHNSNFFAKGCSKTFHIYQKNKLVQEKPNCVELVKDIVAFTCLISITKYNKGFQETMIL